MELFKNNQDQILRSSSGNIMTRPYDFGNAFVNQSDNYIEINRDLSQYINLYMWIYDSDTIFRSAPNGSGTFNFLDYYNKLGDLFNFQWRGYNAQIGMLKNSYGQHPTILSKIFFREFNETGYWYRYYQRPVNFISLSLRDTGTNSLKINHSPIINFIQQNSNNSIITRLRIGRAAGSFNRADSKKINRVMLFDRELSDIEYRYLYNNRLGRDLLSTEGLLLDLHNNRAEILDFSEEQDGSDTRVGVRDYSINQYHGQIMNLPAGTLEEQLNYANANLFKSFL